MEAAILAILKYIRTTNLRFHAIGERDVHWASRDCRFDLLDDRQDG